MIVRRRSSRLPLALAVATASLAAASSLCAERVMTGPGLAPSPASGGSITTQQISERVGFDQNLGKALPGDLVFHDENGRAVRLADVSGGRPYVLVFVYFDCPMLCSLVETGVLGAVKGMNLVPGKDYDIVFVSFDPADTVEKALAKKTDALARSGRPETAAGWHFLTGDPDAISRLAAAAGFRYLRDEMTKQFAHPAGIAVATREGKLARYLFGVEYAPRDLRFALVEAGEGRVGSVVDRLVILCYRYDPTLGKYTPATMLAIRIGGALTFVALASFIVVMARREKRPQHAATGGIA